MVLVIWGGAVCVALSLPAIVIAIVVNAIASRIEARYERHH